jgi:hypothetical protein
LCNFISDDFQKWKSWGHVKVDAWQVTSVCLQRIFEEIHAECIVAQDGYDHQNIEFTMACILWATWKAHMVMEKYLKHHIYDHLAVVAVLSSHLADNYVKPDDAVSSKVTHLEKSLKTLHSTVEHLVSMNKENKVVKRILSSSPLQQKMTDWTLHSWCMGGVTHNLRVHS